MRRMLLCLAVRLNAAPCGAAETARPNVLFIDIYPSLCELAGLPLPGHLQGRSFVPLMKSPDQPWKQVAIGRFRNGETIRTDRWDETLARVRRTMSRLHWQWETTITTPKLKPSPPQRRSSAGTELTQLVPRDVLDQAPAGIRRRVVEADYRCPADVVFDESKFRGRARMLRCLLARGSVRR